MVLFNEMIPTQGSSKVKVIVYVPGEEKVCTSVKFDDVFVPDAGSPKFQVWVVGQSPPLASNRTRLFVSQVKVKSKVGSGRLEIEKLSMAIPS